MLTRSYLLLQLYLFTVRNLILTINGALTIYSKKKCFIKLLKRFDFLITRKRSRKEIISQMPNKSIITHKNKKKTTDLKDVGTVSSSVSAYNMQKKRELILGL